METRTMVTRFRAARNPSPIVAKDIHPGKVDYWAARRDS
jgi:hypothetical protein